MTEIIRVVLAEDQSIVREGLRFLLNSKPDLEVVGEAADGQQAVDLVEQLQPDIVVLDINMPKLNGLEAARRIHTTFPNIGLLILTIYDNTEFFFEAIQAGAAGYILKSGKADDLIDALRIVARGEAYIPPRLAQELVKHQRSITVPEKDSGYSSLSEREREVLAGIAQGLSNRELAERLFISPSTLQTHRTHILEKLGLNGTVDLVRYAVRIGLIEP